jgi:hypothetical protein
MLAPPCPRATSREERLVGRQRKSEPVRVKLDRSGLRERLARTGVVLEHNVARRSA